MESEEPPSADQHRSSLAREGRRSCRLRALPHASSGRGARTGRGSHDRGDRRRPATRRAHRRRLPGCRRRLPARQFVDVGRCLHRASPWNPRSTDRGRRHRTSSTASTASDRHPVASSTPTGTTCPCSSSTISSASPKPSERSVSTTPRATCSADTASTRPTTSSTGSSGGSTSASPSRRPSRTNAASSHRAA